jgi:ABC-type tungstate transport system substrate-binding protein
MRRCAPGTISDRVGGGCLRNINPQSDRPIGKEQVHGRWLGTRFPAEFRCTVLRHHPAFLIVSCSATGLAGLIGLPLGAALALLRFPGRWGLVVILNAFMGLPPVVVGLVAYLLLSRSGPLGFLGLLFTPPAMIVAQSMLVLPIIGSLARQTIEDLWSEYRNEMTALRIPAL